MAKLGTLLIDLALNSSKMVRELGGVNRRLDNFAKKTQRVARFAGAAFATIQIGGLVKDIVGVVDKYTLLEGRLKLVQKEGENLADTQNRLFEVAQRTRTETGAVVDFYTQLARATKNLGLSQETLIQTTETINKAITISGASSASAGAALFQLQQGLAAGALRGQELNSVLEQTPRIAEAIADGLGVTIGELRKLGEEGRLNAETVINALQNQADTINREFSQVPTTVAQAYQQLTNEVEKAVKEGSALNNVLRENIKFFTKLAEAFNKAFNPSQTQLIDNLREKINEINFLLVNNFGLSKRYREELEQRRAAIIAQIDAINEEIAANEKKKKLGADIATIEAKIAAAQKQASADAKTAAEQRIKNLSGVEQVIRSNLSAQESANFELLKANSLYAGNVISLEAYKQKLQEVTDVLNQPPPAPELSQGLRGAGATDGYSELLASDYENQQARLAQDREFQLERFRLAQEDASRREKLERDTNLTMLNNTASIFGSLAAIVGNGSKKQFELSKKLARVETIISTYAAAQKAYEWGAKFGGPVGGAVAAASAIAAGLARLTAINRTTFETSTAASAQTGSGAFVPAPSAGPITPGTNAAQGQTFVIITGNGEQPMSDAQLDRLMDDISRRVNEGSQVIIRKDSVQAQEIVSAVA